MSDLPLVSQSVSQILGFRAQAAEDTAVAKGEGFTQTGDLAEAGAYGTAADIAKNNAALQEVSGQIQTYQAKRQAAQAIGAEQADVSAAGFTASGTNLSAIKSSFQQSYLQQQLIGVQSGITQGGFLAQAAAAGGEKTAAQTAADAAGTYGTAATTAAATATTNAANETAALLAVIQASGTRVTQNGVTHTVGGIAGTPEGQLVTSTLNASNLALPATWTAGLPNGETRAPAEPTPAAVH